MPRPQLAVRVKQMYGRPALAEAEMAVDQNCLRGRNDTDNVRTLEANRASTGVVRTTAPRQEAHELLRSCRGGARPVKDYAA